MSFMHAMQSGHTSLEVGLLRILALLGEDRPRGEYWHMDLLNQVCLPVEGRDAVFPQDVCEHAQNTRRFRNIATRSYESFDPSQATIAVASAKSLVERLERCLHDFKLKIDPPENDGGGDHFPDEGKAGNSGVVLLQHAWDMADADGLQDFFR